MIADQMRYVMVLLQRGADETSSTSRIFSVVQGHAVNDLFWEYYGRCQCTAECK
jgi:hypothetical protein